MGQLNGKVAIVTGASRGIGRALSIALAREGAKIVLASKTMNPNPRLPGTLDDVKNEIEKAGGTALIHQTDVREESQIESLVGTTVKELGGLDILINNAGALFWSSVEQTPAKRFDLVMDVNVRATFLCCSAAIPHLRARGGGSIVNMSPPVTAGCMPNRVAYMISKFGMSMVTEGLAVEVAKDNIKVHSLWPVTMVESQATIGHHMGERSMWRTPEIVVDSTLALLTGKASVPSGQTVYDEDVLSLVGVKDFSRYACVPGTNPPRLRLDDPSSYWRQTGA